MNCCKILALVQLALIFMIVVMLNKVSGGCTGHLPSTCTCFSQNLTNNAAPAIIENICSPSYNSVSNKWSAKAGSFIKIEAEFRPNLQVDAMSLSVATTVCGYTYSLATINDICDKKDPQNVVAAKCPLKANVSVKHAISIFIPIYSPWEAVDIQLVVTRLVRPGNNASKSVPMFCLKIPRFQVTNSF